MDRVRFESVRLFDVVLVLELLDTAAAIDELLLAGEERMALRANVEPDLVLYGPGHECISASASYLAILIIRMDSFFHFKKTSCKICS